MGYISAENLVFAYPGSQDPVLRGLSFTIEEGSFVAIQGPSGSGKSTLLYLLGAMNRVQSGTLSVAGKDINSLTREEASFFRAAEIGFVFQQFHLLPKLNLLENVELGGTYPLEKMKDHAELKLRARDLIKKFGLEDKENEYPNKVSGGQQQRVAIARALMQKPGLILADEPTGNLDSENSVLVLAELKKLHEQGHTVVLITHDSEVAKRAERILHIRDGRLASDEVLKEPVLRAQKRDSLSSASVTAATWNFELLGYFLKNALTQLSVNKMRAALTMLGVVIGVAAVLSMMTLGGFAKEKILAGYAELGVNTFTFHGYPNWDMKTKDIKGVVFDFFSWEDDLRPLKNIFPEVQRISPILSGRNITAVFAGKTIDNEVTIVGVNEDTFPLVKKKMIIGSAVNAFQVKNRNAVCVIGYEIAERLFSNIQPVGQVIFLTEDNQEISCKVIGVADKTSSRNEWRKPNLEIYMPFTYFQAKNKNWWSAQIYQVLIETKSHASMDKVGKSIRAFFQKKYGKTGKFRVDSDAVLVEQMNRFLNIFSGFLAAIALVSLAVGGVGIANMMLVSLNERIREIGLRKALGATDHSLRTLILMESLLICFFAGILGVILGFVAYELIIFAATKFIKGLAFEWIFNPWAFLISFGAIVLVGILSGLVPALRAEKMAPMHALRSE